MAASGYMLIQWCDAEPIHTSGPPVIITRIIYTIYSFLSEEDCDAFKRNSIPSP